MIKKTYPKLKNSGGINPENCVPFQTVGTVVHIVKHVREEVGNYSQSSTYKYNITFEFESDDGTTMRATQSFNLGDVFPEEIGDKMLGVGGFNQWGGQFFIGTHILKENKCK